MHLFNKENIWSSPCSFLHTSSHPDKYKNNNSVNRIISKEKEREDPRRDSSKTSFQLESKSVSSVSTRNPVTTTTSLILHTELILPQEIPKKYNKYKAHPVQASSSSCSPCIQAFYTAETRLQAPYSVPGPYSTSRLPVILPGRISILHGSQPHALPSSDSPGILQGIYLVSTKFTKRFKYYIAL